MRGMNSSPEYLPDSMQDSTYMFYDRLYDSIPGHTGFGCAGE